MGNKTNIPTGLNVPNISPLAALLAGKAGKAVAPEKKKPPEEEIIPSREEELDGDALLAQADGEQTSSSVTPLQLAEAAATSSDAPPAAASAAAAAGGGIPPAALILGVLGLAGAGGGGGGGGGGASPNPAAPSALTLTSDSGGNAADRITNDSTPTVQGRAAAGTTVTLKEGATTLGSAIADANGDWSITSARLQGDGEHRLTAIARDTSGRESALSGELVITLDTSIAAPLPALANDTGVAGDRVTNDPSLTVAAPAADVTRAYVVDGVSASSYVPPSTDGEHVVQILDVDAAGNSASGQLSFSLDRSAPNLVEITRDGPGGRVTLRYDAALGAAPDAAAFSISSDGAANPVSAIQVSGDSLILTLMRPYTNLSELTYDDLAGDQSAAIQDLAGNDAAGFSLGVVQDGYIRGAQIYLDADRDGVADPGEILAGVLTNANGNFTLPEGANPDGHPLLAIGGVNIDTGIPNSLTLSAPAGATAINPITTLIQSLLQQGLATDAEAAAEQVAAALGLPDGVDLLSYDPLAVLESDPEDADALEALRAAAQVAMLLDVAGEDAAPEVLGNFAQRINDADAPLDLSDPDTLNQLLDDGAGGSLVTPQQQAAIAEANAALQEADADEVAQVQSEYLDEIAPAAPAVPDLLAAFDSGESDDDNRTNLLNPTLRVVFDATSTDGAAAVAGDRLELRSGDAVLASHVLIQADIQNGRADLALPAQPEGDLNLQAVLIDQAGHASAASATLALILDASAPALSLSLAQDTGAAGDGITADGLIQVSGLEAGRPWEFSLDGGIEWNIGSGVNFTAPTGEYLAGALRARQSDVAGNAGEASLAGDILVDTETAPPTLALTAASDSGAAGDGVTNIVDPVLTGTAEAGASVALSRGGAAMGETAAGADGVWTFALPALTEGAHDITATATDAAGNQAAATLRVEIDLTAPAASSLDLAPSSDTGTLGDHQTQDITPTVIGLAEGGATVLLSEGAVALGEAVATAAGAWSITSATLGQGHHELVAVVRDAAGNLSAPATLGLDIDSNLAALSFPTLAAGSDSGVVGDWIGRDPNPTIEFTASAGATLELDTGAGFVNVGVGTGAAQSLTLPNLATEGAHVFTLRATLSSGGEPAVRTMTYTLDTQAPSLGAPSLDLSSDTGIFGDGISSDTTPDILLTAEAGAILAIDIGDGFQEVGVASGAPQVVAAPPFSESGDHTLSIRASDVAGNESVRFLNLTLDLEDPALAATLVGDADKNAAAATSAAGVASFTAESGATVSVAFSGASGGLDKSYIASGAAQTIRLSAADLNVLGRGAVSFNVTAIDRAGNQSDAVALGFQLLIQAPDAPTPSLLNDTGEPGDGVSTDGTVVLAGLEEGATWQYSTNAGAAWINGVGDRFVLPNGDYAAGSVRVRQTDSFGETSSSGVLNQALAIGGAAEAEITVNPVTADDIVNSLEAAGSVNITGTVGGDAAPGDTVTLSVNGHSYSGDVLAGNTFSIAVPGADLAVVTSFIATVSGENAAGIPFSASANSSHTVDLETQASINLGVTAGDGVLNHAESEGDINISGTVSGDAAPGDTVSLQVNGHAYSGQVLAGNTFSIAVSGADLAADTSVDASVSGADAAGNPFTAQTSATHTVDLTAQASITLNPLTGDGVLTAAEAAGSVNVTGTVGGDAAPGDTVSVQVNGHTYSDQVLAGNTFSIAVPGADLAADTSVDASVSGADAAGNAFTASTSRVHVVDGGGVIPPGNASISVDPITADDILNFSESSGSVSVTGSVGGDAATGDPISFTVNGVNYNGVVQAGNTFSILVNGAHLAADTSFDVTVTGTNEAGGAFTASATSTHTVDLVAPAAPNINVVAGDDRVNASEASIVVVSGTAATGSTVTVSWGGHIKQASAPEGTWSATFLSVEVPGDGNQPVNAYATDAALNSSSGVNRAVLIDRQAPQLSEVTFTGHTVTLSHDEGLDTTNGPAELPYVVKVNNIPVPITGYGANGSQVTLTLGVMPSPGDNVSVSYADPNISDDVNAIQDLAGNDMASYVEAPASYMPSQPTFMSGGGRLIFTPGGELSAAYAAALDQDGRIVVAGRMDNANDDFLLSRFNVDGSLDGGLSGKGWLTTDFANSDDFAYDLAIDDDGLIYLAGDPDAPDPNIALARYEEDGDLDGAFSGDGLQTLDVHPASPDADIAYAVLLPSVGGGVIVVGSSVELDDGEPVNNTADIVLARYLDNGLLDTTFGESDGVITVDVEGYDDEAYAAALQMDGGIEKIIAVGSMETPDGREAFIARFIAASGSLDSSFGTVGFSGLDAASGLFAVEVLDSGQILVAGTRDDDGQDFLLARFNANGTLDTTFGGGDGWIATDFFGGDDVARDIAIQSDGKVLVGGYAYQTAGEGDDGDYALARYSADGALDDSFGEDGIVATDLYSGSDSEEDQAYAVLIQDDGAIVLVGTAATDAYNASTGVGLVRYTQDGDLDTAFGGDNSLSGTPTYTENSDPITLDANVLAKDPNMAALNGGLGDYAGASLVIRRQDDQDLPTDHFSLNTNNTLFGVTEDNELVSCCQVFGQITRLDSQVEIQFNSDEAIATQALVNEVLRNITYFNSDDTPDESALFNWTFSNSDNSITNYKQVNFVAVNDAPEANNNFINLAEDTTKTFIAADFGYSDPENDVFAQLKIISLPASGQLLLDGEAVGVNDVINIADINAELLTYEPDLNVNGVVAFNFKVSDGAQWSATHTLSLSLNPVNDAPAISSNGGGATATIQVQEDGATFVTNVIASDPDSAFTYRINGGADAGLFTIDGFTGALTFLDAPDFENPLDAGTDNQYVVVVEAFDGQAADSQTLTIQVQDAAPRIVAVNLLSNPGADNNYATGDTIGLEVVFSDAVDIFGDGDPTIDLDIGGVTRTASLIGQGRDGLSLEFGYTLTADDYDADGIGVVANSFDDDGADIQDNGGNNVLTSHDGLDNQEGHRANFHVNLADVAGGHGGFVITAENAAGGAQQNLGTSVSRAGDVNGDGFDDVIVSTPYYDEVGAVTNAGRSYVVFGKASGVEVDLDALGTGGFAIHGGYFFGESGRSVSGAGDVNGDGLDDLIVGAPGDANSAYVVFGSAATDSVTLTALGARGFRIQSTGGGDPGYSVSAAGDVNGDGLDDLIVGNPNDPDDSAGRAFVVFGKSGTATITLESIADTGVGGFAISGEIANDQAGWSVSRVGDMNGDGLDDLLIGARMQGVDDAGRAYVVWGKEDGTPIELGNVRAGQGGFAITGGWANAMAGASVAAAGDVNGDGLDDLIIGSDDATANRTVFVIFGTGNNFEVNLDDVLAGFGGGFAITGNLPNNYLGKSVSGIGDINGDGLDDLLIGAPETGGGVGNSYVVFGQTSANNVTLDMLTTGQQGFVLTGPAAASVGQSVSGAGDVNGDGYSDLLIGAPADDTAGGDAGRAFVVFGGTRFIAPDAHHGLGDPNPGNYVGTGEDETFVLGDGADTIEGGGGDDIIFAGDGDDYVELDGDNLYNLFDIATDGRAARVDGGGGVDTLAFTTVNGQHDLGALPAGRVSGIERLDLFHENDGYNNGISISSDAVTRLSGMNLFNSNNGWFGLAASVNLHQMVIDGGTDDHVALSGDWVLLDGLVLNLLDPIPYHVYQDLDAGAQVLVEFGVNVTLGDNHAPLLGQGDGRLSLNFLGAAAAGRASVLLDDGRIVVGGSTDNGAQDVFGLSFHNPDGSLDLTSGLQGLVSNVGGDNDRINDLAVQHDGSIVSVGYSEDPDGIPHIAMVRYFPDGSVDGGLQGGLVTLDIADDGLDDVAEAVAIAADGKIVVAGHTFDGFHNNLALLRFNSDGSLDGTFGPDFDGVVTWDGAGLDDQASSLAIQSDGKILTAGYTTDNNGGQNLLVARYNLNGTLDTSAFGSGNGYVAIDLGSTVDAASSVVLQRDGKILVTGYTQDTDHADTEIVLLRLNSDGSLDATFDGDGIRILDVDGRDDVAKDLAIQDDGRIVVTGFTANGANNDFFVARFNSDGSLDTDFSGDGWLRQDFHGADDAAENVEIQDDNRIVVTGVAIDAGSPKFALARFNPDGTPDLGFDPVDSLQETATFNDNGPAVVLDSTTVVFDADLNAADYSFINIEVQRHLGRDTVDLFSASGNLSFEGNLAKLNGVPIGYVDNVPGYLYLYIYPDVSQTQVNEALSSIAYSYGSEIAPPGGEIQIDWHVWDGNWSYAQGAGGNGHAFDSTTVTINLVNDEPSFHDLPLAALRHVKDGPAITLASVVDVSDAELDELGDYDGASLSISRNDGANGDDVFAFDTNGALFSVSGNELRSLANNQRFALFSLNEGVLNITFDSANTLATPALVDDVLRHITYENDGFNGNEDISLAWEFSDGVNNVGESVTMQLRLDTFGPQLQGAGIDADTLFLTFDEALDDANLPSLTAFTVLVNGEARGIRSAAVNGDQLQLQLLVAASHADTVTVAYTDPAVGDDVRALQDALGNDAATFAPQAVANETATNRLGGPLLGDAYLNGPQVVMKFNEDIDSSLAASAVGRINGVGADRIEAAIPDDSTVTLALTVNPAGGFVRVDLPDGDEIQDGDGNDFGRNSVFVGGAGNDTLDVSLLDDLSYTYFLYGNEGDDALIGSSGLDRIAGGEDEDDLTPGRGGDWVDLAEITGAQDNLFIGNDIISDSSPLHYDVVAGFDVMQGVADHNDVLYLPSKSLIASTLGLVDGTDSGGIGKHGIGENHLLGFYNGAGAALRIDDDNLDDAITYLHANFSGQVGDTLGFAYDSDDDGRNDSLFVYQHGGSLLEADTLVLLAGVQNVNGLGNDAGQNVVNIQDSGAANLVTAAGIGNMVVLGFNEQITSVAPPLGGTLEIGLGAVRTTYNYASDLAGDSSAILLAPGANITNAHYFILQPDLNVSDTALYTDAVVEQPAAFGNAGDTNMDLSAYVGVVDLLDGYGGNDTLIGNNQVNEIWGGPGADTLEGNGGDDIFHFRQGDSPTLVPNLGLDGELDPCDSFSFAGLAGDVIQDFGVGQDIVELDLPGGGYMGEAPLDGMVADQGYYLVQGCFQNGEFFACQQTNADDTLVVYDGDAATGSTLLTGLVLLNVTPIDIDLLGGGRFTLYQEL